LKKRYLVVGSSRGIGAAVAKSLEANGHQVLAVSRGVSQFSTWIPADVTTDKGVDAIQSHVGATPLDGLLFMGGIWEKNAFTHSYDFLSSEREEIRDVIAVNLIAPIILAHSLAQNLSMTPNPRIVLMGSTSGMDNHSPQEVAYTASKFGLRGVSQSLAMAFRPLNIGVSIINPGYVGTPEVQNDIASGEGCSETPIPLADVVRTVEYILESSSSTVPQEINMTGKLP
jgi:3-oxoacyl-[acyl-carrier protein] reductase